MGMLVNNNTTSNDTSSYFSGIVIDFERDKLGTAGDSARARCFERVYVSDDTNETMGLRGISGL